MGFIKAFTGSLSSTFADQWQDFYGPKQGVPATAALFQAEPQGQNAGRGENYKGNENIITNGSKIIVPEGTALITLQDGAITGFIAEPGGFIFRSDDPNSQSMFAGDGIFGQTLKQTWEKVKFGGMPGSQQLAFYVNLKEIPGIKFGTPETIYWNDSYLELKAGGMCRGTYSLKISDPLMFVKNFVPAQYLQPNASIFDFADLDNEAANQMFSEFITSLTGAISRFSQEAKINNTDTMDYIAGNLDKFAVTMDEEVEATYQWSTSRGLKVDKVSLVVNYDEKTQAVLDEIRQDDQEIRRAKRMGQAYTDNMAGMMAAASADAMKTAAGNEGGAMMGFMGMNMANMQANNLMGASTAAVQAQQPAQPTAPVQPEVAPAAPAQDPTTRLLEMKKLLDAGAISQEEYDKVKAQVLGI